MPSRFVMNDVALFDDCSCGSLRDQRLVSSLLRLGSLPHFNRCHCHLLNVIISRIRVRYVRVGGDLVPLGLEEGIIAG